MKFRLACAVLLAAAPLPSAQAAERKSLREIFAAASKRDPLPAQLEREDREAYREVFALIRAQKWTEAAAKLDSMGDGLLHPIARAELLTAKGSPKAELGPLLSVLEQAPYVPQAPQIARLASLRGATTLPPLPVEQRLRWLGSAPIRSRAKSTSSDTVAADLELKARPLIDNNDPAGIERLVEEAAPLLTPEALTEWRQRTAWSYYIVGDDANARRLAGQAWAGAGEWATQAAWVAGLAAWRRHDCKDAARAFEAVAARGDDAETRAAGSYWAARSYTACAQPQNVQARLRAAAGNPETFYGMLAAEALGVETRRGKPRDGLTVDWNRISQTSNVRIAVALTEIGETRLASEVLRHQAKIGEARDHDVLIRLAARLNLPETQFWLAHNGPAGARTQVSARYPAPQWTPEGGWRVDPALVFAHTLQESKFQRDVISPAGAQGLMQVRPGTAGDIARDRGQPFESASLFQPSKNLEFGQSFLEGLRDSRATGGLLPKVIAAYNAGPVPIERWNTTVKDGGDPLLYIESIPYWETRGYVPIVLRNYWMYEVNAGRESVSRKALAQGLWPRFPSARPDKLADAD